MKKKKIRKIMVRIKKQRKKKTKRREKCNDDMDEKIDFLLKKNEKIR